MSKKTFRPYQPDQVLLLPPSLGDWLPPTHEVYFLEDVVSQLDLAGIYAAYPNPKGYPPYDPRCLLKILLYGCVRGIRSSRRLERACWEDIGFRVLAGNQHPDHWTMAAFRRRHAAALGDLLVQTVQLAQAAGLVRLGHVALDGTKLQAHASKHRAMSYRRLQEAEARLRAEVTQYLQDLEATDTAEDAAYGSQRGDELPSELADRQRRLRVIQEAKARLEAAAREQAAPADRPADPPSPPTRGPGRGGRRRREPPAEPTPAPTAQTNFTDPDSRIMRTSGHAFIQGYNAQAAVDAASQIIVAADLTNQAADSPHLPDMVTQIHTNTGRTPTELSAAAGYYSAANLAALASAGIEAFIPPERIRHTAWRQAQPPRGRIPRHATPKERMRRKLRTKRGRARYQLRQESVEPVFGQIKGNRGLRQVLVRGLDPVRHWWRFECAVHNLLKMRTAGVTFA